MRAVYNAWYKYGTPPWAGSARHELVRLVDEGQLTPGRAVDLGCGEGDNAIFMAQHGFDVTAVDFAPAAIAKAKAKAQKAGASVNFLVDDLTNPSHLHGTFDVLVDYGTFDDLTERQRNAACNPPCKARRQIPDVELRMGSPSVGTAGVEAHSLRESNPPAGLH